MSRDATLDDYAQPRSAPGHSRTPLQPESPPAPRPSRPSRLPSTPPLPPPESAQPASPLGALDLREFKAEARRLLPVGHPVRVVLEAEPDHLAGPDAVGRIEVLMRLILAHRRPPATG